MSNDSQEDMTLPTMQRSQTLVSPTPKINTQNFAGRIGGNQIFTLSPEDPNFEKVIARCPDAGQEATWKELLDLRGFREIGLWKNALIEGIGLCLQVFIGGIVALGVVPDATVTSVGPLIPISVAASLQFFVITLFIFAAGPVTGAHFNPLITMATFLAKLTSLPRAVLYVAFQCMGSIVGAFLVRAALEASAKDLVILPGCYIDPTLVSPGSAFVLETVTSLFLLFLAFGLGLDPRNAGSSGPALTPWLIGLTAALTLFSGGMARKGYLGSSNNPARCLGFMAAAERFTYHYIHWAGDITAAMISAFLYSLVPPYKK